MINLYTCSVNTAKVYRVKNETYDEMKRARDEKIISRLVSKFGLAAVQTALETLLPRCSWSDWQSVANFSLVAARRISQKRREKRLEKFTREKRADSQARSAMPPAPRPTRDRAGRHDALETRRNVARVLRRALPKDTI